MRTFSKLTADLRADLLLLILVGLLLAVLTGGDPAEAATSSVHVEWRNGSHTYSSEDVTSTGTAAASGAAPSLGSSGGVAVITALQGSSVVVVGSAVTATQTNGVFLAPGAKLEVPVQPGDVVSIIAATDQVTGAPVRQAGVFAVLTTTPLAANATYTSPAFDNGAGGGWFPLIIIVAGADVAGSYAIEESDDGATGWLPIGAITLSNWLSLYGASNGFNASGRYHRVVYTNGGTIQTSFRLAYALRN